MTVDRFFRTPKGLLIIVLCVLALPAAFGEGMEHAGPLLGASAAAAMLVDAPILRWREGEWVFPDGALLTGLFVAMILSPREPWRDGAIISAIAVSSKYLLRVQRANVFNPAAFALVATFYLFESGQSWWGALPNLPGAAILLVVALGTFITQRVNKSAAVLAFLGVYYALATAAAFAGDPRRMATLFRAPNLHAALFFAFFMVTDPPTSPPKARDQVVFGAITAVVAFLVLQTVGAAYFLLAGLLAANVWEAGRRQRLRMARGGRG